MARPRGTVTFLFTDIEHSSQAWQDHTAEMAVALQRHDEILRQVIAANHGHVFSTAGDSFGAAFARAVDGISAAVEAQLRLHAEAWPAPLDLRVRMGLHTGEADERDGNYFGPAPNRAARVMAMAHGGQVLCSSSTADVLRDAVGPVQAFRDVGEHELAGLQRPERLHQVLHPDLPSEFGPPRAGPARPAADGVRRDALSEMGVTRREAEVLDAVIERLTNAEIAARLYISERTVESHVSSLLRKLGAADRLELGELGRPLRAGAAQRPQLPPGMALAAESGICAGRAEELDALRELWRRAESGRSLLAIVSGEAGIGKSRLVAELATEVHECGGAVMLGSCYDDVPQPFAPFAEAIENDLSHLPSAELARRVGPNTTVLGRVAPRLREAAPAANLGAALGAGAAEDAIERGAVFAAVESYLRAASQQAPLLLVVEDIHWATASTLDLLRHLVRRANQTRMLMVLTTRHGAPEVGDALRQLLGELSRMPAVTTIAVKPLDEAAVRAVLDSVHSDQDVRELTERSSGNPLFLRELVARGRASSSPAPSTDLVARRNALLAADDREVLDAAAVVGMRFHADFLSRMGDQDVVDVLEALERAEAAGLVTAVPGRPGWFEHRHALFRAARLESLSTAKAMRLHAAATRVLADNVADERQAGELAHHACAAVPLVDAREAIGHAVRAAAIAERTAAFEEAARLYEQARRVSEVITPLDPHLELHLAVSHGRALNRMGDPRHRAILLDAAAAATSLDASEALAEIVWAMSQDGMPFDPGRQDPDLLSAGQAAIDRLPREAPGRVKALAAMAEDLWLAGERQRGRALAEEAADVAQRLDDQLLLAQVLVHTRTARWVPCSDANETIAEKLVAVGRRHRHSTVLAHGLLERGLAALERGRMGPLDSAVEELAEVLDAASMPFSYLQVQLVGLQATRDVWRGDLTAAERATERLGELARGGGRNPSVLVGPLTNVTAHLRGSLAGRRSVIEAFISEPRPGFEDYSHALFTLACAHDGRAREASRWLARLIDSAPEPADAFWLCGRVLLCEAAEILDDAVAGATLAAQLTPFAGRTATTFHCGLGPVDLAIAQALIAAGRLADAADAAASAVAAAEDQRAPIFRARALLRLALARKALGSNGIGDLVAEATRVADDTGAHLIHQESDRMGFSSSQTSHQTGEHP